MSWWYVGKCFLILITLIIFYLNHIEYNFSVPAFIDMPELVTHARNNHQRWRELDEAGVTTIADVKRAQRQNAIQSSPNTTSQPTAEE